MRSPVLRPAALQLDLFGSEPAVAPATHINRVLEPAANTPPIEPVIAPPHKPAPPLPPGVQARCLSIGSRRLDYTLRRSVRRTIGFLINQEGLRVTAPNRSSVAEIERAIYNKEHWIFSKLQLHHQRAASLQQQGIQWCDGAVLPYLGGDIVLRRQDGATLSTSFDATARQLTVTLPPDAPAHDLKHSAQAWLQAQAHALFGQRLPLYAAQLGVCYQSFALSSATTQWGSCTSRGRIRLNWRLIHVEPTLIDYVVAHELAHLREMNHSARFWSTVQTVYPDYAQARKRLRELGPKTLHIFDI